MKHGWSTVKWLLDKLLRLAAAATALIAIPVALIGGPALDHSAATLGLIAGLSIMVFGFIIAFCLLVASVAFWPDQSKKLKTPALVLLSMIYITGVCGIAFSANMFVAISYARSHGVQLPARVHTDLFHRVSQ